MEKNYYYRKHLREPGKLLMFMFGVIVLSSFIAGFISVLDKQPEDRLRSVSILLTVMLVVLGIIGAEFMLIYRVFLKRFKSIAVSLTEDGIRYRNINGESFIAYEEIVELKFPSIKYTGGWLKITHRDGDIRLTVVLENIGDFLKELKDKLDERGMSQVCNEKAIYSFYKTAYYSDQSWARIYDYIGKLVLFELTSIAVSIIFFMINGNSNFRAISVAAGIFLPVIAFVIAEVIIGRRLAKGASKESFTVPERDKNFEIKVYKTVFGSFLVVYLVMELCLLFII